MKKYRYLLLAFVSGLLASCAGTSEEQLIGDWERRAVFRLSGRSHAATFIIGDKGYVVGGTNGRNEQLRDVVVFDHTAGALDERRGRTMGRWTPLKPLPLEMKARQQAVGFSLNVGGKVYGFVGTGWGLGDPIPELNNRREMETFKDFWKYDPDLEECGCTDEDACDHTAWVKIGDLPRNFSPRRGAVAFSLNVGGKDYGYVGYGYEDEPGKNHLLELWRYDPVDDSWTDVGATGSFKRSGMAVFVIDNKAYLTTGESSSGLVHEFYVFDPNAPEGQQWEWRRQMRNANPDEDFDDDYDRGLGRSYGVGFVTWVAEVDEFRGHIVGSNTLNSSNGHTCWEYDHERDLWVQRTSFFNNVRRQTRDGMIAFSFPNGRAFVGLGLSGVTHFDDMWEFFPRDDDYIFND